MCRNSGYNTHGVKQIPCVISLGGNPFRNIAVNGHGGKLIKGVTEGGNSSQELVLSQSRCKIRHRCDVLDVESVFCSKFQQQRRSQQG